MAPGIQPFCSDVRKTAEQLENLGDTGLSNMNLQPISPHTRVQRASAISSSLSHSEQSLELLRQLLKKTQSLHDLLRLEHAVATNSVCPVLQLPDEILRMVFLFYIEDEDNDSRLTWLLEVCHRWRATALVCPQLWTTINPADSIPLLQRSFHPSSNLPLQIYVSRCPPPKYREFEKEQGLIEDVIQQVQQSSVSRLSITGEALRQGLALFDAFGRDSALAMLPTKAVYFAGGHPAFFENRVDMRNVEFPNLEVFELHRCSLPLLDQSQLICSHLSVGGLNTTPRSLIMFLEGFSFIKSLEIHYLSVIDDSHGEEWWSIHLPGLESLALLDSTARDTVNTLGLLDTSEISTLKLDHALAYDVLDDSPSVLMIHAYALVEHFIRPGLYDNVIYLRIADYYVQLAMMVDTILGSPTTLQFPKLKRVRLIPEGKSNETRRGLLVTSIRATLSSRNAQGAESLQLYLPNCMRDVEMELGPVVPVLIWERCNCEDS